MAIRNIRIAAASALALCILAGPVHSKTVTLKFAHWVPPVHPLHKAFVAWGTSITEKSGGSIKFQYFPASQLGKASDHYDMAKTGIADAVWINPGFNPGRWPVTSLPEHPLMLKEPLGASRALTAWYAEYADREMTDARNCLMHTMVPLTIFSTRKAIKTPADLKGVKMRPSNATQARIFKQAGAVTVFSPFPKIRDTFERGIATASTGVHGALIAFGGHKATKYIMDVPLFGAVWNIVLNKAAYNKLDAKQKAVVDGHCNPEWAERIADPVAQSDWAGEKKLRAMGKTFVPISDADRDAWRKFSAPALEVWKKSVAKRGFNAEAILKSLTDKLRAEKALVE